MGFQASKLVWFQGFSGRETSGNQILCLLMRIQVFVSVTIPVPMMVGYLRVRIDQLDVVFDTFQPSITSVSDFTKRYLTTPAMLVTTGSFLIYTWCTPVFCTYIYIRLQL